MTKDRAMTQNRARKPSMDQYKARRPSMDQDKARKPTGQGRAIKQSMCQDRARKQSMTNDRAITQNRAKNQDNVNQGPRQSQEAKPRHKPSHIYIFQIINVIFLILNLLLIVGSIGNKFTNIICTSTNGIHWWSTLGYDVVFV